MIFDNRKMRGMISKNCKHCDRGWVRGLGSLAHLIPCSVCNQDCAVPKIAPVKNGR